MRRLLLALLVASIGVVSFGLVAEAHALLRSSSPADGATLDHAPPEVSITFTERPDPRLSIIHVYNAGGQQLERSGLTVSTDSYTLTVALPSLPDGVYTVSWRTVSAVDGHYAAGSFAFGVGASPIGASPPTGTTTPSTPPPSPFAVAGRWVYYVGLALLLGGTWISLFAFPHPLPSPPPKGEGGVSRRLVTMASVGIGAAIIGLAVQAEVQRQTAGLGWGVFFATSLGGNLITQAIPIVLGGLAIAVAWGHDPRRERMALGVAGGLGLIAIFTHALTTHANASHVAWLMVPAQSVHLTAFAIWIGGLSALLVGLRGLPADLAARAVRRFSFVAGFALVAIAVSGALRAIDEVGTLSRFATLFGGLIIVKVGLFCVLAALGAINRYRNVPRAEWSVGGLRRVGRVEIAVAALVVGVAATLTALAPPSYSPEPINNAPQQVVVSGHDLGDTFKVELTVAPGYPGSNRFRVTVRDYNDGHIVNASRVAMRFDFPGRPSVGESTLELKGTGGVYAATASNLSLAGRWSVTVLVEAGLNSAEVPLTLTTAVPPQQITVSHQAGLPDIYTVNLGGNRSLQMYLDPGKVGNNAVHATFFQGNNELPMADGTVISATPETGPTVDLQATRFADDKIGHFIAQGSLSAGRWRFDVTASSADGKTYQASFEETIK